MPITRTLIVLAAILAAARPATAQNDRIFDTPAGWLYYYSITSAQIADQVAAGFRPFAIERASAAGGYDTVFVHNSGPYQVQGAAVVYGLTPSALDSYLNSNNRRLLDLEVYPDALGGTLMTAITVPNSGGTGTPAWGYLYNTSFSAINSWLTANPSLRLIDLDVYTISGTQYYSAVAVHNSGSNAQGWWYYAGLTPQQLSTELTNNDARLVSLAVIDGGSLFTPPTFACVMVSSNPGGGWWHYGLTSADVSALLEQHGARVTCLTRYTNFAGQTVWAAAMVDNANAQTRRVRDYMAEQATVGSYGFMLKEVGGPVLAALNANFAFEPASMLKILHTAYAIDRCAAGLDNLTNLILVDDTCNPNECPDAVQCSPTNLPLSTVIRRTMENSDNNCTFELETRYTRTALNNFAALLGLTNTHINHRLGCLCGQPFNSFSAADACNFYEMIADGTLFSSAWREELFERMIDLDNHGYGAYPTLSAVINQEAAATSLTPTEVAAFRSAMRFANKGGGYACNSERWRTDGGWASVPFKVQFLGQYVTLSRQYTLATFVHGGTDPGANVAYTAKEEILREQIREALQSWDNACTAPFFTVQPPDRTAPLGGSASFPSGLGGTGNVSYQWQRQGAGGVWSNMTNQAGRFSGVNTATLTISNIAASDATNYRLQAVRDCGMVSSSPATLTIGAACPADWNGDTAVNSSDISAYLTSWLESVQGGTLRADFNGDNAVNSSDISAFLTAWLQAVQQGC